MTTTPLPTFSQLSFEQLDQASGLLTRAFFNDPLMTCYLPEKSRRVRVLPAMMLAAVRYSFYYGEIMTAGNLDGVACWLSPGHTTLTPWGMLRAGFTVIPAHMGWASLRQIMKIEPLLDRVHKACMRGPHWYLMMLAVEPARQGQGIGGALLDAKLRQVKESGLPCYLETMQPRDVPFYTKHGFRVMFEIELKEAGFHTWMMATN